MISLATKHNDPNGKLSFIERLGYGSGDFACNMVYQPISAFLLLYYTNVAGVSAATAASVVAISKIFDAFSDVTMGAIVDRTKSKYGKARPWILRMCIPMAVFLVLMFSVPSALGGIARIGWMFVTYNLVSTVCYTAVNLPYSAMISQMTTSQKERSVLVTFRGICATGGQFFINTMVLKLTKAFGNGDTYNQRGWTLAFMIVGALSILVFLFCFISTKERVTEPAEKEKLSPKQSLKVLVHNKYWLLITFGGIFTYLFIGVYFGSVAYYAQYVIGNVDQYSIIANAFSIAEFVGLIVLIPFILRKVGSYKTYQIGLLFIAVGCIGTAFMPTSVAWVCVMNILKGIGFGCNAATVYTMIADTIDYGDWKFGVKCIGMGNAASSFIQKVGNALGTVILGWVLTWGGFNAANAVQSESALKAISTAYIWLPAILLAINFIVMLFYRLDKEYPQMSKELAERRAAEKKEQ